MKSKSQEEKARKRKINLFELRRGVFHFLGGVILIWCALFIVHIKIFLLVLSALGIVIMLIAREKFIPILGHALNMLEREENKQFPGINLLFFIISSLIVLLFFPRMIALASIAILSIGDPAAGFVGRNFGRLKIAGKKTLEGTSAGIIFSLLFASLFVPVYIALAGAVAGLFFELFSFKIGGIDVDDNFIVPIASGTAMFLATLI
jgi:dolichol kinase